MPRRIDGAYTLHDLVSGLEKTGTIGKGRCQLREQREIDFSHFAHITAFPEVELSGTKFRQRVDAVVEKFNDMRDDLDKDASSWGVGQAGNTDPLGA
jgi:hypothetical protein